MDEYESVILVKPEVYVYQIPPRTSNRGYRAAEWDLDKWLWEGRLRVLAKGKTVTVRLEDRNNGELFAMAKMTEYPSPVIEPVSDSSRYFAMMIVNEQGQRAFIGVGFQERNDSFDFSAALQDHYRWEKEEEKLRTQGAKGPQKTGPSVDYTMKEGQTIKINFGKKTASSSSSRPAANMDAGGAPPPLLPPPPSSGSCRRRPAPASSSSSTATRAPAPQAAPSRSTPPPRSTGNDFDDMFGLGTTSTSVAPAKTQASAPKSAANELDDMFGLGSLSSAPAASKAAPARNTGYQADDLLDIGGLSLSSGPVPKPAVSSAAKPASDDPFAGLF